MEISFETKKLRDLCESETKAKKELGSEIANKLKRRLADLNAAVNVNDLIAGNPRQDKNKYRINLHDDMCIIFCANHNTNPHISPRKVDWSKVTRIKILKIGNYDE